MYLEWLNGDLVYNVNDCWAAGCKIEEGSSSGRKNRYEKVNKLVEDY